MDELLDLCNWFLKYETRLMLFLGVMLPTWIRKPFIRRIAKPILSLCFHTLCVLVVAKVAVQQRWPELLVIAGLVGTVTSFLSPEALAHDHVDLLQELLYLS